MELHANVLYARLLCVQDYHWIRNNVSLNFVMNNGPVLPLLFDALFTKTKQVVKDCLLHLCKGLMDATPQYLLKIVNGLVRKHSMLQEKEYMKTIPLLS